MMKKSFLFLMAFSAIAVFFSCSSDDDDNSGNQYDAHRGIVKANQEVDLGLKITIYGKNYKVIFAKSNLTATGLAEKETDFGDYFAWAATEPWYTSITINGNKVEADGWKDGKEDGYRTGYAPYCEVVYKSNTWMTWQEYIYTKYINENDVLELSDDAAHIILGGNWQLPTKEILQVLIDKIPHVFTTEGVKGIRFSKNNQILFLPATGRFSFDTCAERVEAYGYYWSSTVHSSEGAYSLSFDGGIVEAQNSYYRFCGFPIRPVRLVAE